MNDQHETQEQHPADQQRSAPTPPDELVQPEQRDIPAASERKTAVVFALLGGAAIAISSLMPWATGETTSGTLSITGLAGRGWLAIVLGAAVLAVAGSGFFRYRPRWIPSLLLLVLGGAAVTLVIYEMAPMEELLEERASGELVTSDLGSGLFVLLVGGCSTLAAAQRWWRGPQLSEPSGEDEPQGTRASQ